MDFKRQLAICAFLIIVHIAGQVSTQTLVETKPGLATNTTEGNAVYKCSENEHECGGDGTCIPVNQTCDGVDDCSDASDEANCTDYDYECVDGYECGDGVCLHESQVCDGTDDCHDGADESDCAGVTSTTTTTTTTPTTTTTESGKCAENQFTCAEYECIPHVLVCNDVPDCSNGADEDSCGEVTPTEPDDYYGGEDYYGTNESCDTETHFECYDGTCIDREYYCDGIAECEDGEDEFECPVEATTASPACTGTQFRCASGQCIDVAYLCNGVSNCDDDSDEVNCTVTMSTIVAKILNYTGTTIPRTEGCIYEGEWFPPGSDIVPGDCKGVMCTTTSVVRNWSDPTCSGCLSAKKNNIILSLLALFVMLINWR